MKKFTTTHKVILATVTVVLLAFLFTAPDSDRGNFEPQNEVYHKFGHVEWWIWQIDNSVTYKEAKKHASSNQDPRVTTYHFTTKKILISLPLIQ